MSTRLDPFTREEERRLEELRSKAGLAAERLPPASVSVPIPTSTSSGAEVSPPLRYRKGSPSPSSSPALSPANTARTPTFVPESLLNHNQPASASSSGGTGRGDGGSSAGLTADEEAELARLEIKYEQFIQHGLATLKQLAETERNLKQRGEGSSGTGSKGFGVGLKNRWQVAASKGFGLGVVKDAAKRLFSRGRGGAGQGGEAGAGGESGGSWVMVNAPPTSSTDSSSCRPSCISFAPGRVKTFTLVLGIFSAILLLLVVLEAQFLSIEAHEISRLEKLTHRQTDAPPATPNSGKVLPGVTLKPNVKGGPGDGRPGNGTTPGTPAPYAYVDLSEDTESPLSVSGPSSYRQLVVSLENLHLLTHMIAYLMAIVAGFLPSRWGSSSNARGIANSASVTTSTALLARPAYFVSSGGAAELGRGGTGAILGSGIMPGGGQASRSTRVTVAVTFFYSILAGICALNCCLTAPCVLSRLELILSSGGFWVFFSPKSLCLYFGAADLALVGLALSLALE